MINVKNHKPGDLFDSWADLGPKRRKLLDQSWAGRFREQILEELPVEELARFFKEDFGRPTKELDTVMGAVLLQQALDLTDAETIAEVAQDLFALAAHFSGNPALAGMTGFHLLWRVLHEPCQVTESAAGEPRAFTIRPAKEVSSDSLQNPSDPEAGDDAHKGQGYQVQVMETFREETDPDQKAQTLDLITHVEVESACEHDSRALIPAIASAQERGLGPEQVLADSHYGGDDNLAAAKELGVEVVAPAMSGAKKEGKLGLEDFEFSESGEALGCPAGHAPVEKNYNPEKQRRRAAFDSEPCSACPQADTCPTQPGKHYRYLRYYDKAARLARRRALERTPEFKGRYRMCAGVEATMSALDRRTGLKRLRVRGLAAVRYCASEAHFG